MVAVTRGAADIALVVLASGEERMRAAVVAGHADFARFTRRHLEEVPDLVRCARILHVVRAGAVAALAALGGCGRPLVPRAGMRSSAVRGPLLLMAFEALLVPDVPARKDEDRLVIDDDGSFRLLLLLPPLCREGNVR